MNDEESLVESEPLIPSALPNNFVKLSICSDDVNKRDD